MPDLTTTYLGLQLKNPLILSSSPLSKKLDLVRRAEDAGVAAVVMYSLFEEQINHELAELDYYLNRGSGLSAEARSYFPNLNFYNIGPEAYLNHLRDVKQAVGIPVIGSLNGVSSGGWIDYAKRIEEAGADALELNIYYLPTDLEQSSAALEDVYVQLVRDVRAQVRVPVALKLSPFFTSLPNVAKRFAEAGANGLVLFNRFLQPDFDLEALEVVPALTLSASYELRLPLRWIAILYGRVAVDFAATGGVHAAEDVVKAVMAGASATMLTSALLLKGIEQLGTILGDLDAWLVAHEYESIEQMKGSMSQRAVADPAVFERANYMKALNLFDHALP